MTALQIDPGSPTAPAPISFGDLTDREFEVFHALAVGLNNREMADALFIGEATVKTHVARVFRKLNVRDRVQAVVLAYEAGVVQPRDAPTNAAWNTVGVAQRATPARP